MVDKTKENMLVKFQLGSQGRNLAVTISHVTQS